MKMIELNVKDKTYLSLAKRMVDSQIRSRGVLDSRILEVMSTIPRHMFVDTRDLHSAYGDYPLTIGHNQTISQPYIVAYMTELLDLRGDEKVLELGTGSGYQTAVIAALAREVHTIERVGPLKEKAQGVLKELGITNVSFYEGDGTYGLPEAAPFDRIIVTAAAPNVPDPLKKQLADNGLLVLPVGDYRSYQIMYIIQKVGNSFSVREDIGCRFVPLLGKYGF